MNPVNIPNFDLRLPPVDHEIEQLEVPEDAIEAMEDTIGQLIMDVEDNWLDFAEENVTFPYLVQVKDKIDELTNQLQVAFETFTAPHLWVFYVQHLQRLFDYARDTMAYGEILWKIVQPSVRRLRRLSEAVSGTSYAQRIYD